MVFTHLVFHSVVVCIVFFYYYNLPLVRLFFFHFLHVDAVYKLVGVILFDSLCRVNILTFDLMVVRYSMFVVDFNLNLLVVRCSYAERRSLCVVFLLVF
jgi:hypothetical protein